MPSSDSRESVTLVSAWPQKGHLIVRASSYREGASVTPGDLSLPRLAYLRLHLCPQGGPSDRRGNGPACGQYLWKTPERAYYILGNRRLPVRLKSQSPPGRV